MSKLNLDWIIGYYNNVSNDTSEITMAYVKRFNPEYNDIKVFRRRIRDNITRYLQQKAQFEEDTIDFDELEYSNLSARKNDGTIMDIKEYCEFYKIPYNQVKSYKLVNHTDRAYYNIQSIDITKGGLDFELFQNKILDMISNLPTLPQTLKRDISFDNNEKCLLVLDIADIHIGKYSSAYEVGENDEYNIDIALKRVYESVERLLKRVQGYNIEKILFVIGNDVLHTDTTRRTTTGNTPQDTQGMWFENFLVAKQMYVNVINRLLGVADVHVQFNPSNHDYMSGFMLAQVLEAYYKDCENTTFQCDMSARKYFAYGKNLIGTTHGDSGKERDYPLAMAHEAKEFWGITTHKYIYTHHIHSKRSLDYQGVTVESMRSISGADSWHHKSLYQHAPKSVECFIHEYDKGQIARFTHTF